jgi:predicted nucleic acid-binding protein
VAEPASATAYVFDAWSIMAYLGGEEAGAEVEALVAESHESGRPLHMSVINAAEVWYAVARRTSDKTANQSLTEVGGLGIAFEEIDMDLAMAAASIKARHKMSLADCFAAALAMKLKAELVTGDREFEQVVREVRIRWLPAL